MIITDLNNLNPQETPEEVNLPVVLPAPHTEPWPPKLAFDLALGVDHDDVCLAHDITPDQLFNFMCHPAFRREVSAHERDIRENGVSFRSKAKVFAESYLVEVDAIIADREIAVSTRLDAIKNVVKWAGLEPQPIKEGATSTQPQFNIQINL